VNADSIDRSLATIVRLAIAGLALTVISGTATVALGPAHGAVASAQSESTPPAPGGGRHLMASALMSVGLSDAQKAKIRSLVSDTRAKNHDADPATRRANWKNAFAKIDTMLSPDQRTRLHAKLDQMRKEQAQGAAPQS
jgi:hypothetical protein